MTLNIFKCWLGHKWTRWGNPFVPEGRSKHFVAQRRSCERCGVIQQHFI